MQAGALSGAPDSGESSTSKLSSLATTRNTLAAQSEHSLSRQTGRRGSSTVVFKGAGGAPWPGLGDLFKGQRGKNRAGLGRDGKQLLLPETWCQEGGRSSQGLDRELRSELPPHLPHSREQNQAGAERRRKQHWNVDCVCMSACMCV